MTFHCTDSNSVGTGRALMFAVAVLAVGLMVFSPAQAYDEAAFVTTWETTEADQQIFIPTAPGTDYDFTIDWGDGTVEEISGTDPDPTHVYAEPGTYQVAITGQFPRIHFDLSRMDFQRPARGDIHPGENAQKLVAVEQWGAIEWISMEAAFAGAANMALNATDAPDLSEVTTLSRMFALGHSFNGDIGHWDVSGVEDMSRMFEEANEFDQDIGGWDVANVVDMERMFYQASSFDQDLSGWCVWLISHRPDGFDDGADRWELPRPSWGSPCP